MARDTPRSDATLGINGATPEVEMVILGLGMARPFVWVRIDTALEVFLQLYNGSPWPMNTKLVKLRFLSTWDDPSGKSFWECAAIMYCPTTSDAVNDRCNFCVPVWQNVQANEHPIWDERHNVDLLGSGIMTDSMTCEGLAFVLYPTRNLRVPSVDSLSSYMWLSKFNRVSWTTSQLTWDILP